MRQPERQGDADLSVGIRGASLILKGREPHFEIRARCRCRSCGKTRELGSDELHGAASIDAFKELERRFRCSDCGERIVSIEPVWHKDWFA